MHLKFLVFLVLFFPLIVKWNSLAASKLIYETRSKYSHIKVKDKNGRRYLYFVRDTGREVIESAIYVNKPYELCIPYTKFMFSSRLFVPQAKHVLIIGLGGGSMVHFINHYFPETLVDSVEIDPKIVSIARKYFFLRPRKGNHIIIQNAYKYIASSGSKYDIIYMDAFLKPSAITDSTGMPENLKSKIFYTRLKKHLTKNGIVVFNLNSHKNRKLDIENIKKSFFQTFQFKVPNRRNLILVAVTGPGFTRDVLEKNGSFLDREKKIHFSMKALLDYLK
ncbi:MAG: fused MFS/spermidine synthase [Spirochaetota bacterium]